MECLQGDQINVAGSLTVHVTKECCLEIFMTPWGHWHSFVSYKYSQTKSWISVYQQLHWSQYCNKFWIFLRRLLIVSILIVYEFPFVIAILISPVIGISLNLIEYSIFKFITFESFDIIINWHSYMIGFNSVNRSLFS